LITLLSCSLRTGVYYQLSMKGSTSLLGPTSN